MAQLGRISGPLLEANLLRKDLISTASPTQANLSIRKETGSDTLLKIDVINGRIGVDVETPVNELQVSQTTRTIDLIGNTAGIANFTVSNSNVVVDSGDIQLIAGEHIQLSNLETEQFYLSDNYISTINTNTNIDLVPNGTGTVEVQSGLEVFGSLNATGNITLDGTIVFGDSDTDTVNFNADVTASIVPDLDATYNLGSGPQRWKEIYTGLLNGQLIASGAVNVDGISLDSRQGGIFYVAKGGSDTNVGDHPNGALLTIQEAIARCDASTTGPVAIYVYPGEYEEALPIVVPDNVSIIGVDLRNVIIKPTVTTQDLDVFHLGDSSTVQHLTIKDFYYNSTNNTGYAFRFAPGAVVTSRSPYVQNITVITKGSVTTTDDPRGFAQGDAGKGAYINGAELDSASIEASMLFHSCTFIVPGVDAITMTNGVRVEWLNSFTYFANRGLYAVNGLTGRTSYDGSTVQYGAEVRSIGSASVYGNYGAVADGADSLMYLIQHNFGYIGAGKFVDNDESKAIQVNEVVELNSGKIHYVTTNHNGNFRVGDNFLVDFETGNTTINIDSLTVNQFTGLRVNTGANTTVIDGSFIDTGNITIANNTIETNSGDLNITAASGKINLQNNTYLNGNLNISGDLSYAGVLNISGDEATDSLTFNVEFEQDFNPNTTLEFDLGSFEKQWLLAHLNRIESNDISIYDNVIETNVSNANLDLRANGTGKIYIPDSATFSNALTVSGTTTINSDVDITDPLFEITGNLNQTGDYSVINLTATGNLDVGSQVQLEEILFDGNVITTTTTNADLELRANGTGTINLQENVQVTNNLSANNIDATNAAITVNTTVDNVNIGNVEINDNYIETTSVDGDLILAADQNIAVPSNDVIITPDLTVNGATDLQGTSITGTLTHVGATIQTGNVTLSGDLTNGNLYLNDNYITTTSINSDLLLAADRNVVVPNNDVVLSQNLTVSGTTALQGTSVTGMITHIGDTSQTGNVTLTGNLTNGDILIDDNVITTTTSNSDLDLRASGTGEVIVPNNNVVLGQELTVSGATDLQATTITGVVTHTGDRTQVGNYTQGGELTVDNLYFEDNFITTTSGNLILAADRDVVVPLNDVEITNNLTVSGTTDLQDLAITGLLTQTGTRTQTGDYTISGELTVDNVYIEDNFITTTGVDQNLELRATVGETIYVPNNDVQVDNNLTVSIATNLQGTAVTGTLTQTGDRNQTGNYTQTGDLIVDTVNFQGDVQFTDVNISDNIITTTVGNNDLDLRASGTGQVVIDGTDLRVSNNLFAASITTTDINIAQDLVLDEINIVDSNIEINDNYISTATSNSNLELRATGNVVVTNNTIIQQDLTVNGDSNLTNTTIAGLLTQTGNRIQTGNYDLTGNLSINALTTTQPFDFGDVQISGNVLETTLSNSNLDLRAAGTGQILFNDNVNITNNLTVSTFNVNSISVANSVDLEVIELSTDVQFFDNVIATTNSNSNLELRAAGTGSVNLQELNIVNSTISTIDTDITIAPLDNVTINSTTSLLLPRGTTAQRVITQDLFIDGGAALNSNTILDGGTASTIFTGLDTIYNSGSASLTSTGNLGDIRFNTSDNVFEGTSSDTVTFGGVYSGNRRTRVTAHPTNDTITLAVNNIAVGGVTATGLTLHGLQADDIFANNNTITTNVSNSNLELSANGTGELVIDNISIVGNSIKNDGNNILLKNTGFGKVKFAGTAAIVVPYGTTAQQPQDSTPPQVGDTRWNTDTTILETWDGNQYISSAGVATAISEAEYNDLLLEYTLIFG